MDVPKVRYAQNAGVNIAYQIVGEGPRDLLFVCGTMSHIDLWWSYAQARSMIETLAAIGRLIIFDKPGTGLSDPIPAAPTIDQRAADLLAVLDAAGSQSAVIIGYSEGALPSVVLAATQPQRVEALVLLDAPLTFEWTDDLPVPKERYDAIWRMFDDACEHWGDGILAAAMAPSWATDTARREVLGAVERTCMSPGMARSILQGYRGLDVRPLTPAVHVPTLVLHCSGSGGLVPTELGLDSASRIVGAVLRWLRGSDHLVWIQNATLVPKLIEEFLTGRAAAPRDDDRVLTTVVFTDIVDSTARLEGIGDAEWRRLLADHDRRMDGLLVRYGGEAVKHTGDGRLVHFPRPARAVRFSAEMVEEARRCGLAIRAGIHTGECESVNGDLLGLAVNIASRMTDLAGAGEVVVSSTVKDLVIGSGLSFDDIGDHELKGLSGSWRVHRFIADNPGPLVFAGYETDVRFAIAPS